MARYMAARLDGSTTVHTSRAARVAMFTYSKRNGWTGLMGTALYAITDKRTGALQVRPGDYMTGIGPEVDIRVATRGEAETHWQSPLHTGWIVAD